MNTLKKIRTFLEIYDFYLKRITKKRNYSIEDICSKKIVIGEEIKNPSILIYFEQNNINKIPSIIPDNLIKIPYWGNRSKSNVIKYLTNTDIELEKSIYYILENVIITRNSLFCRRYRKPLTGSDNQYSNLIPSLSYRELDTGVLANNYFSNGFWGHWLISELPMQLEMSKLGTLVTYHDRKPFFDEPIWRDTLGLPVLEESKFWYINKLFLADPKAMDPVTIKNWFKIRKNLKVYNDQSKYIYVKRGNTGKRRILKNEIEFINKLESMGFVTIEPGSISCRQTIEQLTDAEIVIGVEGSHMDPVIYTMKESGQLIVLQPPNRVGLNAATNATICGICSSVYICDPIDDDFSFKIDIDDFMLFLNRMSKWSHNNRRKIVENANKFEFSLNKISNL